MFLPALAALMVQGSSPAEFVPTSVTPHASDAATLTGALHGRRLELALRGAGLTVQADAIAAESGCATRIVTTGSNGSGIWSRLFRWTDVAWSGELPDGRAMVAFYEDEGRFPGDRLTFAPADPSAFHAALTSVVESCRGAAAESSRVLSGDYPGSRSCYFQRYPGIELVEPVPAATLRSEPTRAVITVLAQESPEAELRLLIQRPALGHGGAEPEVAFTVAAPGLRHLKIAAARFTLDGAPIEVGHSLALYNHTRLRIRMDPFRTEALPEGDDSFYRRLSASNRATIALIDTTGESRAVFSFDTGPMLVAARRALDAAAWSCGSSAPAPTPASEWKAAD